VRLNDKLGSLKQEIANLQEHISEELMHVQTRKSPGESFGELALKKDN